jgi:shikimate kinase
MHLVVLYGAPGAGKLTVARELATLTGYKVFHNHLTVDLVGAVFPFGSEPFDRLCTRFRLDMIHEAALASVPGMIFTFVYAAGTDNEYFRNIIDTAEAAGGRVTPVLLTCDVDTLRQRVIAESRAAFGKIRDVALLDELMREHEFDKAYPDAAGLKIDTTHSPPSATARRIQAYLEGKHER